MTIDKMPVIATLQNNFSSPQQSVSQAPREGKPSISHEPSSGDKINLRHLTSLSAQQGKDDIDLNKVRRLQQAIEQGTYQIDAAGIADALIATAQEDDHD